MATRTWVGSTQATADTWTLTVGGTWLSAETLTLTVGDTELVLTIGSTVTTSQICAEIVLAWNGTSTLGTGYAASVRGSAVPEMNEITAEQSGSTVIFTKDTAGTPFTISVAEASTSGTVSFSHTVTATGPNYWSDADNWSEGSVPTTSDDVYIDTPVDILYGLDQNAVTLTSMTIGDRFTGAIGLPDRNANGYGEYRDTYLKISATTVTIRGSATRCRINLGTAQTAATVFSSGSSSTTGLGAVQILGTHASNTLRVEAGDVSVAAREGEVSTFATVTQAGGTLVLGGGVTLTNVTKTAGTLTVGSSTTTLRSDSGTTTIKGGTQAALTIGQGTVTAIGTTAITTLRNAAATVTLGPSCSWTTVDSGGGTVTLNGGGTTLTSDSGAVTVSSGSITTVNINGGTFSYGGTGTLGTVNWSDCTLNFASGTTAGCTITTLSAPVGDCVFNNEFGRVTVTNGFPTPNGVVTIRA